MINLSSIIAITGTLVGTHSQLPDARPKLYVVSYSHLDTEWCWTYRESILDYIPNTLRENFELFEKNPHYTFNWTGALRYRFAKEYHPDLYAELKRYVAAKRWNPTGSMWEEADVLAPSPESIIRQVLYGNQFFKNEFGRSSNQFMLPDAFGFPASLPTIIAHCGLSGFSTKKLNYGAGCAVGIPFNVGRWIGPDGSSVLAVFNPGDYRTRVTEDLSQSKSWMERLTQNGQTGGFYADYMYHGNGDLGGSPGQASAEMLEKSVAGTGPIQVLSAGADDMFRDAKAYPLSKLPSYQGDLLLIQHSAGSITSGAYTKQFNRRAENLAKEAEATAASASILTGMRYPHRQITDAWQRTLNAQMHDILPGTSIPHAYDLAWNDQAVALNQFRDIRNTALRSLTSQLDTRGTGIPVVIQNPLSVDREDIVRVTLPGHSHAWEAVGPDKRVVPVQVVETRNAQDTVLFPASVFANGFAVYHLRPSAHASKGELSITKNRLENHRYVVSINPQGDVSSIFDKRLQKELLRSPKRTVFTYERPQRHPAWNMEWEDRQRPIKAILEGPPTISIVEQGMSRVALRIDRTAQDSKFSQLIRLSAGSAGERVEFIDDIDWRSSECSLKVEFPLTTSNPFATYSEGIGVVKRGNNDPKKFEVPAQRWFDLSDPSGSNGVRVLTGSKLGSDKPDDHTVRLTLLYTPGVRENYQHQASQDWGHHSVSYGIESHVGGWDSTLGKEHATRIESPLSASVVSQHPGSKGRQYSLLRPADGAANYQILAIKRAEASEELVVRLVETGGKSKSTARLSLGVPIAGVRELDGQEQPIPGHSNLRIAGQTLEIPLRSFGIRTIAIQLPRKTHHASINHAVALPFDRDVTRESGQSTGGTFENTIGALPGELLPKSVDSGGVRFELGPQAGQTPNAMTARGQVIQLPPNCQRVAFLAAADTDIGALFRLGKVSKQLVIQAWKGEVGQADKRLWEGTTPTTGSNWPNRVAGIQKGFEKPAPIAWYSDHRRRPDGSNAPYEFCYLFRYELSVPKGSKEIRFPNDPRIKVMALTAITGGDGAR